MKALHILAGAVMAVTTLSGCASLYEQVSAAQKVADVFYSTERQQIITLRNYIVPIVGVEEIEYQRSNHTFSVYVDPEKTGSLPALTGKICRYKTDKDLLKGQLINIVVVDGQALTPVASYNVLIREKCL